MNTENRIVLPDGRILAYAEFGRPNGNPVLYFHGAPSSRLEPLLIGDEAIVRLGLRVIAPDRPGMGGSDFQRGRGLSHWPSDVVCLADALGLGQFAVLGNSGGGPYVAACAARIPDRLRAAVIVSGGWRMDWPEATNGLPFVNRLVMILARRAPRLLRLGLSSMGRVAQNERDRDKELKQFRARMPPADYTAIEKPGRLEAFGTSIDRAVGNLRPRVALVTVPFPPTHAAPPGTSAAGGSCPGGLSSQGGSSARRVQRVDPGPADRLSG